jgi:hypothetical protein
VVNDRNEHRCVAQIYTADQMPVLGVEPVVAVVLVVIDAFSGGAPPKIGGGIGLCGEGIHGQALSLFSLSAGMIG